MRRRSAITLALLAATASTGALAQAQPGEVQTVTLRGDVGGRKFDGIGVVEGGGATSVMLKDYPKAQRDQILDLIFKPKFGASVSTLYVEIPGDGNSTQGSMPSHMHTRDDLDYGRGYIWWEMQEARKRNPSLTLDGTAWSTPGWIGTQGRRYAQNSGPDYGGGDPNFFSDDMVNYYVSWLKGLRQTYGMEMDALGIRNEKGVSYDFAKALRSGLDRSGFGKVKLHGFDNWQDAWKFKFVKDMTTDKDLRNSLAVIGAHINMPESPVPEDVKQMADQMGKPIWNSEGHVYIAGYDGLTGIVRSFNENFVRNNVTKIVNWYGIAALYTMQAYSGDKEAALRANWPWSGHYYPNPSLWGYAHYGQFTGLGWTYINGGSGELRGGGTYVTLKSPKSDYSVIIETKTAKSPQQLRFQIGRGLSANSLAVWRSNEKEQFIRQADLKPVKGMVTIQLDPNSVYSLTTTRGQQKGSFDGIPAKTTFPMPYGDDYEGYGDGRGWGRLPHYMADIAGAFELTTCPERPGHCLRQMAPAPTISWAPEWTPFSIIGDDAWSDYRVSVDVHVAAGEKAAVMGRVNNVGTGYGYIPQGYYLELAGDGTLRLVVSRGKVDKKKLIGDAEQQALIKAQNDASEGGEKVLSETKIAGIAPGQWHKLELAFDGASITGSVDGRKAISVQSELYKTGMAGLLAGHSTTGLSTPYYDNLQISTLRDGAAAANSTHKFEPIY